MGSIRRPYSAPCRFFLDEPAASNRINWYIVPSDTPCYNGPTVFTPRIDSISDPPPTEREKTGPARGIRKYIETGDFVGELHGKPLNDDGHLHTGDLYGLPGDEFHGDTDDFMGRSPKAKYFPGGVPPAWPCKGTPILAFLLLLESTLDDFRAAPLLEANLLLEVELTFPALEEFTPLLLLSSTLEAPRETPPTLESLLVVTSALTAPAEAPDALAPLLLLSSILEAPAEAPESLASLLLLSSTLEAPRETPPTLESLLVLTSALTAPAEAPEALAPLLLLSSILEAPAEAPESLASMLLLDGALDAPRETPPTLESLLVITSALTAPAEGPESLASMLLLDAELEAPAVDPEELESLLLLDSELTIPTEGSGSGSGGSGGGGETGLTCATAITLAAETLYTFDDAAGETRRWFRFFVAEDDGYTISYRTNSGEDRYLVYYEGGCDALEEFTFTHTDLDAFDYGPVSPGRWIYFWSNTIVSGAGNWSWQYGGA